MRHSLPVRVALAAAATGALAVIFLSASQSTVSGAPTPPARGVRPAAPSAAAPPATPPAAPSASKENFDAPVEFFLNREDTGILLIDFDTGASRQPPTELLPEGKMVSWMQIDKPRLKLWALSNGFDAAAYVTTKGTVLELTTLSTIVVNDRPDALYSSKLPGSVKAFDVLKPAEVRAAATAVKGPWEESYVTGGPLVTLTYPFRTRQGAIGLVQLIPTVVKPAGERGFMVRYKLIHGTAATQPATQSAARG